MGTSKQAESLHETMNALIQSTSTIGEIGNMVCISRQLGKNADTIYTGKPHLIVLTPRTSLLPDEDLKLDVFFIDNGNPRSVEFFWKPLGEKEFRRIVGQRQLRNHFTIHLPKDDMRKKDIEYYIKGFSSINTEIYFPSTAPENCFTVVKLVSQIM